MYMDIYDGNVWKDFEKHNGVDFLNNENNLALMMNFNFFQPYEHVKVFCWCNIFHSSQSSTLCTIQTLF